MFTVVFAAFAFNRFVLPIISDMCSKYAVTKINREISDAVDMVIDEMQIKTSDFTREIEGRDLSHIDIDSLLINQLTNRITARLSEKMNELSQHEITVPSGAFSGVPLFSRLGFDIPLHISSVGDAQADYETELTSAGVNQVSYQVWLNIKCSVTIVTPFKGKEMNINRRLLLVNTILNGKVPEGYANIAVK